MARSVIPITVSYVTTVTPARIPAPAVARGGYALLLVSHANEDEGPQCYLLITQYACSIHNSRRTLFL
jgi:hypothetical protein